MNVKNNAFKLPNNAFVLYFVLLLKAKAVCLQGYFL